ncbi:Venom metalloproteinase antarease-like, partial [Folsomia candida]
MTSKGFGKAYKSFKKSFPSVGLPLSKSCFNMKAFTIFISQLIVGISCVPTRTNLGIRTVISSNDGTIALNLKKPVEKIFHPNFRVLQSNIDKSGNVQFIDRTPMAAEIENIEGRMHVDRDSDTVVQLRNIDGETQLSLASQPFIENNKNPDGSYDHGKMISDFAQYMQTNSASLPPHDVGALMTNATFPGALGVAYVQGACSSRYKYSVNRDLNALFQGIPTLAHELGHLFGSPHDGDVTNGAGSCPSIDGYLMSGSGRRDENGFYFSQCSKTIMNSFFGTAASNCLYSNEAPSSWTPSPFLPGDRVEILDICRDFRADSTVSSTTTPDDLCKNVRCSYSAPCPPPNENRNCQWTATLNIPPPDGVRCGDGG